eukprot:8153583-Ditylum_brightwellii.AAC.1
MVVVAQYWPGGWMDTLLNGGCQSLLVVENAKWTEEELKWIRGSYNDVTVQVTWVTPVEMNAWTNDFLCSSMWWMDGDWSWIEDCLKWHIHKCSDTASFAN